MQIKDHCLPGAWRNPNNWMPLCAWPETTVIQWGNPVGDTFFEVFPVVNGDHTIIHTKGKSLEDAEAKAFKIYQHYVACKHEFERREYTSGCGICKNCGMFQSGVFEPIEYCCQCNNPKGYGKDNLDRWWCQECFPNMPEEFKTEFQKEMDQWSKNVVEVSDEEFEEGLKTVLEHIVNHDSEKTNE